jgi:hypothetical protein
MIKLIQTCDISINAFDVLNIEEQMLCTVIFASFRQSGLSVVLDRKNSRISHSLFAKCQNPRNDAKSRRGRLKEGPPTLTFLFTMNEPL